MDPLEFSKEQLLRQIGELNAENLALRDQLAQAAGEAGWTADRLKARTRVLNERVKELECLYHAFQVFRDPDLAFEQRVGRIVDLLPKAYQHPDAACARAVIGEQEFRSNKFQAAGAAQEEPIRLKDERVGLVEVRYLRELPAADEGPFLREERMLIRILAECLGALCELEGRR